MTSTKTSGLGHHFAFGGYLIGGDIQSADMHGGIAPLDVTDITQSAHSRIGGLRDGEISVVAYMNPAAAQEHAAFSPLTRADVLTMYVAGSTVGGPALSQNSLQLNYDPTRAPDGSLTEKVDCQADRYGQEWGVLLTPGPRTDTAATNGASYNQGAATAFGAQAYLQAIALTGTDVTVTIQHSANNSSWSTLMAFTEIVSGNSNLPQSAQRISISNSSTVDQYLRAITTTSGGFTSFKFIVAININPIAGVVF
jgi:hypothetical protein